MGLGIFPAVKPQCERFLCGPGLGFSTILVYSYVVRALAMLSVKLQFVESILSQAAAAWTLRTSLESEVAHQKLSQVLW
jgi:hypothetical protein